MVTTLAALAACTSPFAAPQPSPLPSPTPHTAATATVLQPSDVSSQLGPCAGSGSFSTYLAALNGSNLALAQRLTTQWKALQKAGATDAAISLYAADPSACSAELAATTSVKSAASLVIAFGNEGQADRAWQAGILGFTPPVPGELPPGVARGVSTGLGSSSWTYQQAPIQLACWRKNVFVAVVVFTNLDSASFKAGAAAVNARLN